MGRVRRPPNRFASGNSENTGYSLTIKPSTEYSLTLNYLTLARKLIDDDDDDGQSAPMATLYISNDSRASSRAAICARDKESKKMDNLSKAIALLESNDDLRAMINRLNHPLAYKTPPATLRDIVDAIAARRGVTLYKEAS